MTIRAGLLAVVLGTGVTVGAVAAPEALAQAPAGAPKTAGTVKSTGETSFTVTTATGDVVVTVPAEAKVLMVPPGSKTLAGATAGTMADVTTGDRVLVTGTAGDAATALTATRVVLMKAGAIAATHAAEEQAWAQGGGGIVKSVDAGGGAITLSSGGKMLMVHTTAKTIVRRYAPGSVKFEDATLSTLSTIKPGDQLRVRGEKSADGGSVTADEVVVGTFANYSGLLTGIDATAGTITLKDLTTKKVVTVAVTPASNVRRLPAAAAAGIAARLKGGAGPAAGATPSAGASAGYGGAGRPAGGPGGPGGEGDAARRSGRAGSDLSGMLNRLPTETLGGLKPGEAVMMVATEPATASGSATAVTLVVGVEALITSSGGETMTLSPWSLGGGDAGGAQ